MRRSDRVETGLRNLERVVEALEEERYLVLNFALPSIGVGVNFAEQKLDDVRKLLAGGICQLLGRHGVVVAMGRQVADKVVDAIVTERFVPDGAGVRLGGLGKDARPERLVLRIEI